jgi:hypothetical protein
MATTAGGQAGKQNSMSDHLKPFRFQPGQAKTPGSGRKIGTRNKLSEAFISDLHDQWLESGRAILKILAVENPAAFAAIVAKVIPAEFTGEAAVTVRTIVTGVVRAGEGAYLEHSTPQVPAIAIAAPAPKDDEFQD